MIRLVRYKVKPEQAAENERLVRAVFDVLRDLKPQGLRYTTLKADDGLTFVHLVSHESDSSRDTLTSLPAFKAFSAGVRDRCTEPPLITELNVVGSYGFFEGAGKQG
jgi:hypothetical protein